MWVLLAPYAVAIIGVVGPYLLAKIDGRYRRTPAGHTGPRPPRISRVSRYEEMLAWLVKMDGAGRIHCEVFWKTTTCVVTVSHSPEGETGEGIHTSGAGQAGTPQ